MMPSIVSMLYTVLAFVNHRQQFQQSVCMAGQGGSKLLDNYHYIVVGSGSAGSVVAKRLAAEYDIQVLLLESGGQAGIETDLPVWDLGWHRHLDWSYTTSPQKHIGQSYRPSPGVQTVHAGRVVGGTSTINFMHYNRGNRQSYDDWSHRYGAQGWSYREVLPYFRLSEHNSDRQLVSENPGYHGTGGPLAVTSYTNLSEPLAVYYRSVTGLGYPSVDINGKYQSGIGLVQYTCDSHTNLRSSTSNAYLMPSQPNLHVMCKAHVTRVLFRGRTAIGVEYVRNGRKYQVYADNEVIISAGAIGSPKLLMQSGLGPARHLQSLDIPVVADLPAVGSNLKDHLTVPLYFGLKTTNTTTEIQAPDLTIEQLYQFLVNRTGPLMPVPVVVNYYGTDAYPQDSHVYPDTVIYAYMSPAFTAANSRSRSQQFDRSVRRQWLDWFRSFPEDSRPVFSPEVGVVRIKSQGSVRLDDRRQSTDDPLGGQPSVIIDPNYLSNSTDMSALVSALKFLYYIIEMTPFANYIEIPRPIPRCQYCPDGRPIHRCDQYIRCLIRETAQSFQHFIGTCRMGGGGGGGGSDVVVDERLRVKHVHRLRVIDASVMPDVVNANTNAAVIMIGEKGAQMVSQDNREKI